MASLAAIALVVLTCSAQTVNAQWSGHHTHSNYVTIRTTHAVLGILAWVVFFPAGAVVLRVLSGPRTWLVHACVMMFAWGLFIVNAGLGIWLALIGHELNTYHPVIGLVLLALVSIQPLGGWLHHYLYKQNNKSEFLAMYHIWMGRVLITLGMINGGLGLLLSGNASKGEVIAYGIITAVIWISWIAVVVAIPLKRGREIPGTIDQEKRASIEYARSRHSDYMDRRGMSRP